MIRFRAIAISGASRGLGAALAELLAAPGVRLLLMARGAAGLAETAARCTARGAAVTCVALDIRDAAAVASALAAFEAEGAVDLVVANAGVSAGTTPLGAPESRDDAARVVSVNLLGAINLVGPLLPGMLARGAGTIGLVASVAAFRGLPDAPAYSASKAGLLAWGDSLRAAHPRLRVVVVCPGFFRSAMEARFLGAKPFAMPLEAAAARTLRALERGSGRAVFPAPLGWALRLVALLPPRASDALARLLRFRVRPE